MTRAVVNRFGQFVLPQCLDPLPRRLVLRGADFDNEIAARDKIVHGLPNQAIENGEAAGASVQGQTGLVVADSGRQMVQLFASDVRGIAEDKVKALTGRNGRK